MYRSLILNSSRTANHDYTLAGTDIVIRKGDLLAWNARVLHHDNKYWDNPDEFYPEHFAKEAKASRSP